MVYPASGTESLNEAIVKAEYQTWVPDLGTGQGERPGDGPSQPVIINAKLLSGRAEIPSISRFSGSKTAI